MKDLIFHPPGKGYTLRTNCALATKCYAKNLIPPSTTIEAARQELENLMDANSSLFDTLLPFKLQ